MREVICTGPTPPDGEKWCTVCAIRFKTELMEVPEIAAEIEALQTGDGPAVTYDLIAKARHHKVKFPDLAVTVSVCMPLNGTLVPLCWGHVQGLKFTSVQPAAAGQVPLLRGRG